MRTKRQLLYDKFYYDFEQWMICVNLRSKARKLIRSVKFDKSFHKAYKNTILPYWERFGIKPRILWYKKYYHLTGELDPRYIPDDIHHRYIIPYFDNPAYLRPMQDKNLFSLLFPHAKQPETLYKCVSGTYCTNEFVPLTREDIYTLFEAPGRYIIKPTRDTGGGADISVFSAPADREAVDKLLSAYRSVDYIVQRIVTQHPDLAKFNQSSLNSIRVITLVQNGEAHILSSIFRIGQEGSFVDNVSIGGYQAVIRPDGTLAKYAYTNDGNTHRYVEQTASGISFESAVIPSWDKIQETVKSLAVTLPHMRLIGWDIAVDESGEVVLIEFNCHFGQNQSTCGPTFGDRTEDVLSEVFGKKGQA